MIAICTRSIRLKNKAENTLSLIKYQAMKAIEIKANENMDDVDEEELWMKAIGSNPAFNFLNDPKEDIYSITDGEPFND